MLPTKVFPRLLSFVLSGLALGAASSAQCELQTIVPGPDQDIGFTWHIAQDGRTFALAAKGSVHIYEQDGLTAFRVAEIVLGVYEESGVSLLGLEGDTLAVGVNGGLRIYERHTGIWGEVMRFPYSPSVGFYRSLAVGGGRLAIGAYEFGVSDPIGVVYVYEKVAGVWTRVARLTTPTSRIGEYFGEAVDIDGDRLAIGVGLAIPDRPSHVFVYDWDGAEWQPTEVRSSRPAPFGLGTRLDLRGDMLLVNVGSRDPGALARLFEYDGAAWVETAELAATDTVPLGSGAVAIADENRAFVGSPGDGSRTELGGAVYVFERVAGTWQQVEKLYSPSPWFWQRFGWQLSCEDGLAIISSHRTNYVQTFSARKNGCRTLSAYPHEISLAEGGRQTLRLDPGREHAGRTYWLLGSLTGFDPGFRFRGARIPLVPDSYFRSSLPGRRRAPFLDNVGVIGTRKAEVTIDVPAGLDLSLAGLTLYHAFIVLDHDVVKHVSNVRTLTLVP